MNGFQRSKKLSKDFSLSVHLGNNARRQLQGGLQDRRNRGEGRRGFDRHPPHFDRFLFQPVADYAHNIATTPLNF